MLPLLRNDNTGNHHNRNHEEQEEDEDSDNEFYTNNVRGSTSESSTSYHSSSDNLQLSDTQQVRLGTVNNTENDTINENGTIITKLRLQQKLYNTGPSEDYCSDTEKCLQRYFKTIYCQVKFFTDTKEDIKCPNFVVAEISNNSDDKQIIQICTWLLMNIGKGHYGLEEKIMFWKTYWKMIYKEISKLRMGDTNKFKTRFIKGT